MGLEWWLCCLSSINIGDLVVGTGYIRMWCHYQQWCQYQLSSNTHDTNMRGMMQSCRYWSITFGKLKVPTWPIQQSLVYTIYVHTQRITSANRNSVPFIASNNFDNYVLWLSKNCWIKNVGSFALLIGCNLLGSESTLFYVCSIYKIRHLETNQVILRYRDTIRQER